MELKGKKISFLGDSITEGVRTTGAEARFSTLVGIEGEFREVKNHGIGGTRIARQTGSSDNPIWDRDFCMRVEELDEDSDIVMVLGGVNDFYHGDAPIGTKYDKTVYTFWGAVKHLMTRLHERFPGKPIIIMTPIHLWNEGAEKLDGKAPYAYTLDTYVNIIREAAEMYSLPVLDLHKVSGIMPDIKISQENYIPDGIHPNDAGHRIIADKILAFLRAM